MVIQLRRCVGYTINVRFTTGELAAILGGTSNGIDATVDGVSIDSRKVTKDCLFVALIAERDGHDFIDSALASGAGAYLHSRPGAWDGPGVGVADTAAALAGIGSASRARLMGSTVIGVTGSVGKTSVKDLTAAACSASMVTHANEASFNNELGLPITLANAPADTQVAVLEMGARGKGHIKDLCEIARPNVGVITKIAAAHTELFGTLAQVADAKGELVESLPGDGTAVLNADDKLVMSTAGRTRAQILTFGTKAGDVRATDIVLDDSLCPAFKMHTPDGTFDVKLAVAGAHMAVNAAAAVAAAIAAGSSVPSALEGLAKVELSPLRMDVVAASGGGVVINDTYNANPTSMRAALAALGETPHPNKVAVLGIMGELGQESDSEHLAIASEAAAVGIRVIAVDCALYGPSATHVKDLEQARHELGEVSDSVSVLVKGSRVAQLERLAKLLTSG